MGHSPASVLLSPVFPSLRIVMDKATGKAKGTAFVEFKKPEAAKRAADACTRGRKSQGPGITLQVGRARKGGSGGAQCCFPTPVDLLPAPPP